MFALGRRLGGSVPAAIIAALVFGFSGFAILHLFAGHIVFVNEWPFTPLVVLAWIGMQGAMSRGEGFRRTVAPAAAWSGLVAVQFFCGHPQIIYYTLLIVAALSGGAGWRTA